MTLHVVDTSTYLFRAFVTLPPSIALPGTKQPANALYGLLGTLQKLVKEQKVTRLVCAYDDVAADDERIALDPNYKVSRREFPEELAKQYELCTEMLDAAGFAVAHAKGWEADDVIATIALKARKKGETIAIVGNDKDLLQALEPGDEMYDLGKDRHVKYEEADVVLGVPAKNTPDFLGLAGDAVDQIEGVPGIGKKTAALLINALGSIDDIYRKIDKVPSVAGLRGAAKIKEKLIAHEADARRARQLAVLKTNAPVEVDLPGWTYKGTTEEGRKVLRERFGFDRIVERLPKAD